MKNLSLISFVGVDTSTKLEEIKKFSALKLKYEFGVLHSISKNGTNKRYPKNEFSKEYLNWTKDNGIRSSLHLCGNSIDKYLEEDLSIIELCLLADRIQLNLNIRKYNDYQALAENILKVASKYSNSIILQKNATKHDFNNVFLSKMTKDVSLSLLNDSSGGFGRQITKVSPPHDKYFTGYAGGISPDNVLEIIKIIEESNADNKQYYIDMESGVRIDNNFSLDKCWQIANLVE